jgi:hypothetical protein
VRLARDISGFKGTAPALPTLQPTFGRLCLNKLRLLARLQNSIN